MRRISVRFLPDEALLFDPEPVYALRAVRRGERDRIVAASLRRGRFALVEQEIPGEKSVVRSVTASSDAPFSAVVTVTVTLPSAAALSGAAAIILPPAGAAGASAGVSVSALSSAALYMAISDSSLAVLLAPFAAKVPPKVTPAQIATAAAAASAP